MRAAVVESGKSMRVQWKMREERAHAPAARAGVLIVNDFDRKPFVDAMSGIYDKFQADGRMRQLVERIRSVQ